MKTYKTSWCGRERMKENLQNFKVWEGAYERKPTKFQGVGETYENLPNFNVEEGCMKSYKTSRHGRRRMKNFMEWAHENIRNFKVVEVRYENL